MGPVSTSRGGLEPGEAMIEHVVDFSGRGPNPSTARSDQPDELAAG
jgi:hypothetical protein